MPLLCKPGLLTLKNRVSHAENPWKEAARYIFILCLGILISGASYLGTSSTLASLQEFQQLYFISPVRLLELLFFFLFSILTLTSGISFLSVFLLSHDLEMLRAAPLSPFQFIMGKFSELMSFSGWILFFFGIPVVLAFGSFYNHPILFYTSIGILFPTFALLSTGIGALAVLLLSFLIPANRVRECVLLLSLLFICGGYIWFRSDQLPIGEAQALADLVRLSILSSNTPMAWFPSTWFAALCATSLTGPSELFMLHFPLVLGATGVVLSLLYVGLRIGYERLYSQTINKRRQRQNSSTILIPVLRVLHLFLPPTSRAFFIKELRLFLRDITQSVQLILLLTLCLVYLYNFQNFEELFFLTNQTQHLWHGMLSLMNIFMGMFLLIALSARFAFPSVSLEGQAWWILQSSPLTPFEVLRYKTHFWFTLFSLPTVVIFGSGALALQLPVTFIVIHIILGLSLCHLFLGLGVAYGARYVKFEWEHPAQLTSSLGNFYFMILATGISFLVFIPILLITALHSIGLSGILGDSLLFEICALLLTSLFVTSCVRFVNKTLKDESTNLSIVKIKS